MKLKGRKKLFAPQILSRGKAYYEEGAVDSLKIENDEITAEVYGTELYEVTIWLDGNEVEDMDCTCPYAEDGSACKHEAAVLFALESRSDALPAQTAEVSESQVTLRKAVERLSESAAKAMLLDAALLNQELREKIIRQVTGSIPSDQINRWMREIPQITARYSDYGYIDYDNAYYYTVELATSLWRYVKLLEVIFSDFVFFNVVSSNL